MTSETAIPPADPPSPGPPPLWWRPAARHAITNTRHTGPGGAGTWTFRLTWLDCADCDHAQQTATYRPSPKLRHLLHIRQPTCSFPGCRRPAVQCDDDHTIPFHLGGNTCLCNLGPLCRKHHRAKQTPGWALQQTTPGTMTWTTPTGRHYTTHPATYPQ